MVDLSGLERSLRRGLWRYRFRKLVETVRRIICGTG